MNFEIDGILDSQKPEIFRVETKTSGPKGKIPINPELLLNSPSGNLFAFSQNAGMGWKPSELRRKEFLILSTQGGIRDSKGKPTRLLLSLNAWGASSKADAIRKGKAISARNKKRKDT